MLLESAGLGAKIQLDDIPKPEDVLLSDWLKSFPSFGFLITCNQEKSREVINLFSQRHIACCEIGTTNLSKQVWVHSGDDKSLFWDLNCRPFTGFNKDQPVAPLANQNSSKSQEVLYA